jgi:hypothetical protein
MRARLGTLVTRLSIACALALCACAEERGVVERAVSFSTTREGRPAITTVPFVLDAQRILLEATFETPDGAPRTTLVWLNMGMSAPALTAPLFRELAIDRGRPLDIRLGDLAVRLPSRAVVDGDGKNVGDPEFAQLFGPYRVEAMLPMGLFQDLVVTIDYRRRLLTLARPGARRPRGVPVPCKIEPRTGLVTVEAVVDGRSYPFVIDAGAGYSWMRGETLAQWLAAHPRWLRARGAVGLANNAMLDFAFETEGTLARAPEIAIGDVRLRNVGLLGTGPILGPLDALVGDVFWDNWQKSAPEPVVGWLGGNALKPFTVTIDYPGRTIYWQAESEPDAHDLDQVAVTLARREGRYLIGGLVRVGASENPSVVGLEIGDELVAVDGAPVVGASKDEVLAALHGAPGERRVLTVERRGERRAIEAAVTAFD